MIHKAGDGEGVRRLGNKISEGTKNALSWYRVGDMVGEVKRNENTIV